MFALNARPVQRGEQFMCVPPIQSGREVSFEEIRIDDYLKAYMSTGRPPPPVPQVPTAPHERVALGLPPLFEPHLVEPANTSQTPTTPAPPMMNGTSPSLNGPPPPMPTTHAFRPVADDPLDGVRGSKVYYQSVVCQSEFQWWSPEELRLSAYARGQVFVSVPEVPVASLPNGHNGGHPPLNISLSGNQAYTSPAITAGERMMTMSCEPQFSKHSPEELRLVFVRAGHELTSDEIIARNAYLRMQ